MISGGPDPLFVKAMVVPSREVVVRFSPGDVTVRPPEYQITSAPAATIVRITTHVIGFIRPPVSRPACAQFVPHERILRLVNRFTHHVRQSGIPILRVCRPA